MACGLRYVSYIKDIDWALWVCRMIVCHGRLLQASVQGGLHLFMTEVTTPGTGSEVGAGTIYAVLENDLSCFCR